MVGLSIYAYFVALPENILSEFLLNIMKKVKVVTGRFYFYTTRTKRI